MIDSKALMDGEIHLLRCGANVRDDPEAADELLRSQIPTFVGTWSVTRQLYFTMAEVEELTEKTSSEYVTVTNSMDAGALKKRYQDLVFK